VEILVRPGCHLCDDALPVVERAVRLAAGTMVVVDIEGDDHLVRDFGLRIPVVRAGGRVVAEGVIDGVASLWRALIRSRLSRGDD